MKSILKLGFAMGGGVSLGTFCGAALTEVIKLHVLEIACALKAGARPAFDEVEVDVFSGASAGCLSLALMLRGLAHQTDDEVRIAHDQLRHDPRHAEVVWWLEAQSAKPGAAGARASGLLAQLVAVQTAQFLQHKAWVEEIQFNRLLPSEGQESSLSSQPGLVNLGAVADIAREYILERLPREGTEPAFPRRQLLSRRVLFGASLANVSPMVNDARGEFDTPGSASMGLTDGMRSAVHREMRVIDLNFSGLSASAETLNKRDNQEYPYRWILAHTGPPPKGSEAGDTFGLGDRATWNLIATTAMASGAVPFAFPPVVLERWDYEYGYHRDKGPSVQKGCTWPAPLRSGSHPSYPFSFVDGGTFNNEPIREAFRLASFLDSRAELADDASPRTLRRIVFVDPFVSGEVPSLSVGLHHVLGSGDKGSREEGAGNHPEKRAPFRRASLDKLVPHIGQLLGAVLNEARVVEADKVYQTRERFRLRRNILEAIALVKLPPANAAARQDLVEVATRIIAECRAQLVDDFYANLIPTGNLSLADELRRVLRASPEEFAGLDPAQAKSFCEEPAGVGQTFTGWFKALLFAYVDVLMDLGGKTDQARLIAIAPVKRFEVREGRVTAEPLDLAGAGLGGFAGFMHEPAKAGDFEAGRYCAGLYLQQDSLAEPTPENRLLNHATGQCFPLEALSLQPIPDEVLKNGLERLARRVSSAVKQAHLIKIFPGLDQVCEAILGNILAQQIKKLAAEVPEKRSFELWVDVQPTKRRDLELDGKGVLSDSPARPEPGREGLWLVTTMDCHFGSRPAGTPRFPWKGYHLEEPKGEVDPCLPIYRDSLLSLNDRKFCDLRLPDVGLVEHALATGALGFECRLDREQAVVEPISPDWRPVYAKPLAL